MANFRNRIVALLALPLLTSLPAYAAKPIDLNQHPSSYAAMQLTPQVGFNQISQQKDFNQTTHTRLQQTYAGYKVWGGDFVRHTSLSGQVSMNGIIYDNLARDLAHAPAYLFNSAQAEKALQQASELYRKASGNTSAIHNPNQQIIVYVDQQNKAHWAYLISFDVAAPAINTLPSKPRYILDAVNFTNYQNWDDIQTDDNVHGGGFGGNEKMGERIYDGEKTNFPVLPIERVKDTKICSLINANVSVENAKTNNSVETFNCGTRDAEHNHVFWDADQDAVNGGYSPGNDAMFGGEVIKEMYQHWYGVPVLMANGKPMLLHMRVHNPIGDNAYWDGYTMNFGDGVSMFYPLTSLGVAAHEISHGFTQQHSGLVYNGQSGGMNEAYSDMAAQGAEFYAYHQNSWQIGPEIFKQKDKALRYMDQPSKDCYGKKPGSWCSIDDATQYYNGLDVHFSSGVYNHVFYLIGTSTNWNTRKAFDVMVQANKYYWTSNSTFATGACGVIQAAKDYGYDVQAVKDAFTKVAVNTDTCS